MFLEVRNFCCVILGESLTDGSQYLGRPILALSSPDSDWFSRDRSDGGMIRGDANAHKGQNSDRQMFLAEESHWLGHWVSWWERVGQATFTNQRKWFLSFVYSLLNQWFFVFLQQKVFDSLCAIK